jgi:hypothetical protein
MLKSSRATVAHTILRETNARVRLAIMNSAGGKA